MKKLCLHAPALQKGTLNGFTFTFLLLAAAICHEEQDKVGWFQWAFLSLLDSALFFYENKNNGASNLGRLGLAMLRREGAARCLGAWHKHSFFKS